MRDNIHVHARIAYTATYCNWGVYPLNIALFNEYFSINNKNIAGDVQCKENTTDAKLPGFGTQGLHLTLLDDFTPAELFNLSKRIRRKFNLREVFTLGTQLPV